MIPSIEKMFMYLHLFGSNKIKTVKVLNINIHRKAQGDYYFDCSIQHNSEAYAISFGDKTIPYHYKVKAGEKTPNVEACIKVITESATTLSKAYEVPECVYFPLDAAEDFWQFLLEK